MRGVPFYIDERAIVPRSFLGEILDSELFAGEEFLAGAQARLRSRSVLDLCTGSGCLAILAALRFPQAKVDAVELSKDALEVARTECRGPSPEEARSAVARRSVRAGQGARATISSSPIRPTSTIEGMASLPPECRHEPRLAFDGGSDGLSVIRRILDEAGRHLNEGGGLLCEVGRGRSADRARLSGQAVSLARHRGEQRRGVLARRRCSFADVTPPRPCPSAAPRRCSRPSAAG